MLTKMLSIGLAALVSLAFVGDAGARCRSATAGCSGNYSSYNQGMRYKKARMMSQAARNSAGDSSWANGPQSPRKPGKLQKMRKGQ